MGIVQSNLDISICSCNKVTRGTVVGDHSKMVACSHEEEEILLLPLVWLRGGGGGDRELFTLIQDCYVEILHFNA